MKSSTTYASDLTTIGDGIQHMIGYAQNAQAGYIEAPTNDQQQDGVVPLDRLPAQWWNWFLNKATRRFTESEDFLENAVAELDNVLDVMGITPDPTSTTQLKTMFSSNYLQQYLPKIAAQASAFSADATHENHILVADDDGNNGHALVKVPYAPSLVVNSQLISTSKNITLPANCPYDGQTIKVVFANGHKAGSASDHMTLNVNNGLTPAPIVSNQNGTLDYLPIHELTAGTYSVLQANTILEMYYTETGFSGNPAWVIVGNPVALSSSSYTIYADGKVGNEPVGTIIAMYDISNPYGYLFLNGSTFDTTKYPKLYSYLGSNTLPDYCEYALVGGARNTHDSIAVHDEYQKGEGKDDCFQDHTHYAFSINNNSGQAYSVTAVPSGIEVRSWTVTSTNGPATGSANSGRASTVTRGKRKAVFFYIKAM